MLLSSVPYKFSVPWGSSATTGYITSPIPATASGANASQALGFPPITAAPPGAGGIPPDIADFNGLGKYVTTWLQWVQAGGPVAYDAAFSTAIGGYPKGATLANATTPGLFWISSVDGNTTDPDTGGAGWIGFPTAAVNAAMAQFQSSMGTTGWTKTPRVDVSLGSIIEIEQWGFIDFGAPQTEQLNGPYNFMLPFTVPPNITLTTLTPSAGDNVMMISKLYLPTTTQFWVWNNWEGSTSNNAGQGFYWRAKGY